MLRRRPRRERGALDRAGGSRRAAADQPGLRRSGRDRCHRPRRSTRCCARCRADTFWTVTCIGRHHRRMLGARAAARARRGSAPASRTSPTSRRASWRRRTPRWSRWRSGSRATLGREVADQAQTGELLRAWLGPEADRRRRDAPPARAETREAIDRAAIELFARLGYHATSMRALAAAADVQPAAIYHWYPNKEAILVGLQDDFMERLTEQWSPRWTARTAGAAARRRGARARRLPRGPPARRVRHRQRDPGAHRRPARAR